MPHVVWSAQASTDVRRIHDFVGLRSTSTAENAVATLLAGVALLERFPCLGQAVLAPQQRLMVLPFGRAAFHIRYRLEVEELVLL